MKRYLYLLIILSTVLMVAIVKAQSDETLSLSEISPAQVTVGQASTVTIHGTGFGERTSINLSNYGALASSYVDSHTLTASIPNNLAAGSYTVTAVRNNGTSSTNSLSFVVQAAGTENVQDNQATVNSPVVASVEPANMQAGMDTTITLIGSNFTNDLVVRLQGYGLLTTTFVNSSALTAIVPATVAANGNAYNLELIAGNGQTYPTTGRLRVTAPQVPTEMPLPTEMPMPTEAPPAIQTAPLLQLTNFTVDAASISAAQTFSINLTISNRGNETARAISLSLASNTSFVPASGQVSMSLPDIAAGASTSATLSLLASPSIAAGPVAVPLSISYQNPLGENLSADAEVTVLVEATAPNSQLIVDAYTLEPTMAEPGELVNLRLTLFNVGESTASQVMLTLPGENGVLLPNQHGNAYPIGDIEARQHTPVELSLLVNSHAESGHQMQAISISYFENGEMHEISSTIVVDIAASSRPEPLLLLASYDAGVEVLQPGNRFTLSITLENAGAAPASNTLIGYVAAQAPMDTESSDASGTIFAPVGTAGLDFVGNIDAGAQIESSQEFMVAANVPSGIYPLTISFDYLLPDGTSAQVSRSISLLVMTPPQIQLDPQQPLPESIFSGETTPIDITIRNLGHPINLQSAVITSDNGEILDGANTPLLLLQQGEDTTISALILPAEEGSLNLTLTLNYVDELNQTQSLSFDYSAEVFTPAPVEEMPTVEAPIIEQSQSESNEANWFGRMMLAFLGLGS